MAKSRRIQNLPGSANLALNSVKKQNTSAAFEQNAAKSAGKYSAAVSGIIKAIKSSINDSDSYNKELDSRIVDVILGRVASLLDEFKATFAENELEDTKNEILNAINEISTGSIFKAVIGSQISSLLDQYFGENNSEDLKKFILENLNNDTPSEASPTETPSSETLEKIGIGNEDVDDYNDRTIAKNFSILQAHLQEQFNILNKNLKNITGKSGLFGVISGTIGGIFSAVNGLGKGIFNLGKKVTGLGVGIVGKIGKIGGSIKSLGSKVGGALMSPFKKIGSIFKNPFKKSDDAINKKKEAAKDKIFGVIAKVVEKIWNLIEPFVDKILLYAKIAMVSIIIPIATILATILAVVAGITIAGVLLYLAFNWIKDKALEFWDYIVSGKMLDDIISGLKKAWDWICDFGKWLWNLFVDVMHYIFVGVWVDLGKWIWKKLCQFGKWLYNEYIYPWIVAPINILRNKLTQWLTPIMEKLQPFIESAQNLIQRIKDIWNNFQWDENKSFIENLQELGSMVKTAVLDWWNESPFKTFYDEYLDPIIKELQNLMTRIKTVWDNFKWDENKSFVENLMDFWTKIKAAITDWWKESPIKTYWDKLVDWLTNWAKKIKDWWNNSSFGKTINGFIKTIQDKLKTLADAIWDMPVIGPVRPFGFLVGKPFRLTGAEKKEYEAVGKKQEAIDKGNKTITNLDDEIKKLQDRLKTGKYVEEGSLKDRLGWDSKSDIEKQIAEKQRARDIAQQHVGAQMAELEKIQKTREKSQQKLDGIATDMSQQVEEKEAKQQQYNQDQYFASRAMADQMSQMNKIMADGFSQKSVVGMPVLVGSQNPNQVYM